MSGVVHPIGPEEPRVYWRRRLLVGSAAVLSLVLLSQVFTGGDDGTPTSATIPVYSESAAPLVTSLASPNTSGVPIDGGTVPTTQAAQPTAAPIVQVVPDGECSDAQISMQVDIDRTTTAVGEGVQVKMTLKNNSTVTCKRDVGSGANEITVSSGAALIWSTDHCNASTEKDLQELAPGQEWSIKVVWIGKQTDTGCKVGNMSESGTYLAAGRNGNLKSDGKKFEVR